MDRSSCGRGIPTEGYFNLVITKYDNKPTEVSLEKAGKIYRYLQIEATNLKDKLEKAIVTIQVEKTWASNNGFNKNDLALFKFDDINNKWNELSTVYLEEDDTYYYYEIELTSFSYFVISSKVGVEGTSSEEEETGVEEVEGIDLTWLWIIIGIVVLGVVIGGGVAIKKNIKANKKQ